MRNNRREAESRDDSGDTGSAIAIILSMVLVFVMLQFPGHPDAFSASNWLRLPLELPAIILLLLLSGLRLKRWLCIAIVLGMGLLLLLRIADLGAYLAFNRRFSPLLELHLLGDGWNLASTAIGPVEAGIVVLLALCVLGLLAWLVYRCLRTISQITGKARTIVALCCLSILAVSIAGQAAQNKPAWDPFLEAKVMPEFADRLSRVRNSIADQKLFVEELQHDAVLDHSTPTFAALADRDVILIFVESYGRSYIDAERFTDGAHERLQASERALASAGLHARSGWLTSPIRGGRSWLAHATLQSGLTIDNQARFDRLITTQRHSLSRLFQAAGWQSAGLMPGIQLAWPEGAWYGYEPLLSNAEMGYAGQRFGYVTMPDQYTLSHFEQSVRHPHARPVMATIALLSTHAPWTPLPRKINWEDIGDGSVFDGSHRFGEPINWSYRNKVQSMYANAFDYTLDVLADYVARFADDALIIIVGDHQPPPIINGWGKSGDVPIHLISRDKELLNRLPDENWANGMLPEQQVSSQPMSSFRKTMSTVFE